MFGYLKINYQIIKIRYNNLNRTNKYNNRIHKTLSNNKNNKKAHFYIMIYLIL